MFTTRYKCLVFLNLLFLSSNSQLLVETSASSSVVNHSIKTLLSDPTIGILIANESRNERALIETVNKLINNITRDFTLDNLASNQTLWRRITVKCLYLSNKTCFFFCI